MGSSTGWLLLAALLVAPAGAAAQTTRPGAPPSAPQVTVPTTPFTFDGPPPPVPPATESRDAEGRVTIRAVRVPVPPTIDGRLDESLYSDVPPASGFIQSEPNPGAPATDQTDVWLSYDDDNVYVSARCWDSQMDRLVATEMRRDNTSIFTGNDMLAFVLDTFYDRRNGVAFIVNPIGGRMDGQVSNESQYNGDWNPVWRVATGRFDGGWTVEAAIPFKSLRYRPGRAQIWGFNVMRPKRSRNELSFLTRMPPARGQAAFQQVSLAATVVGIEAPAARRPLEIKPYLTSNLTTDAAAVPRVSNDPGGDVGLDVKYGLTQGLTSDFTYRTDFAQVEADEQQVNLTRFSLFFPEKREFFLENQGTFAFGGVAVSGRNAGSGDTPILFYSRRIGLDGGQPVPIEAGGRISGRAGPYSIGVLDIQSGDAPVTGAGATNFSVVRVKRDILRRSSIGVLATGRSAGGTAAGRNLAYGVDGAFAFFQNLTIDTYWARTHVEGVSTDDTSYLGQLDYNGDRYGVKLERLAVGSHFNPAVGFVRRTDMRKSFAEFRFSPRSRRIAAVRKFSWTGSINYIEDGAGRLETREQLGEFQIQFQNSDQFNVTYTGSYDFLPEPFPIASGVTLPVGGYGYDNVKVGFNLGQRRPVTANLAVEYGTFYDGHKTAFSASRGRVRVTTRLSVEPTYSFNRVRLLEGNFTTHLLGSRVTYTMTPQMFVSALVQYNSGAHAVSTNARLRWEYQPGSELFVVYNEGRDTGVTGFPALINRALIVKVNRLFRY